MIEPLSPAPVHPIFAARLAEAEARKGPDRCPGCDAPVTPVRRTVPTECVDCDPTAAPRRAVRDKARAAALRHSPTSVDQ